MRCVGCSGYFPYTPAPGVTHPYMQASPACWSYYGEFVSRLHSAAAPAVARWHHVDCYAVQHPGGAETDRRQRQSVAVHLLMLCLLLERGLPPERASAVRGRVSATVLPAVSLDDWPFLAPPTSVGSVTVADLREDDAAGVERRMRAWADAAWDAWQAHHDAVRTWADALASGRQ